MSDSSVKCPFDYIVIEGLIGVGKTSLTCLIADKLGGRYILEEYESNPFIEDFYRSPKSHAFKTQLFFLVSRFKKQLEIPVPDLFESPIVVDYIFQKDRIFANVNLDDSELELYNSVWNVLAPKVRPPDIVVYLQSSTQTLLKRIRKRGRSYENSISFEYLEALNNAYNDFFFRYTDSPVFIVNTDNIDFIENSNHLDDLIDNIIKAPGGTNYYHPGGL